MARKISLLKAPGSLFLGLLLFIFLTPTTGRAFSPPLLAGQKIALFPHFTMVEDSAGLLTAPYLYRHPADFNPLTKGYDGDPTSYYWLRTPLHLDSTATPGRVLTFSHLTYVDIYLYSDSGLIVHKLAGAFRPRSELSDGDGRLYTILPMQPGKDYTLLLQVHHTKHYQPVFDFELQPKRPFYRNLRNQVAIDAAMLGAVALLFIYTLLSWIVSRFRPYAWLLLFITGIGLYVVGSSGYYIEWFSPDDPPAGWLLNVHFLHAGMLGLYFLVADFWRLKTEFPRFYFWGRWVPALLIVSTLASFIIDYFTGNYKLTFFIHFLEHPLMLTFIFGAIYACWRRLSPAQRYLGYGIILCGVAGLFITANGVLHHERSLSTTSAVSDVLVLAIVLLFSTGLKEEMRHNEVAKQAALQELNRLQQHQNSILENMVAERTEELAISNKRLLKQKQLLGERNSKIEILINELNHRVKNNLQLLYSLLSLQLPIVKDGASRDILKGNIGKIRAMMLVNQKLFNFEQGRGVGLCEFVSDLSAHLQKIYDTREKTRIIQDIPADIRLGDKHTLSFGLILSELFTNTFKHAFPEHSNPCIRVQARELNENTVQFLYSDNGIGIAVKDEEERFTMGIPLIRDLTRQMNGQMSVTGEKGLSYSFTIPV